MSQETPQSADRPRPVVRAPLSVRENSRRTLDQRLSLRLPWVAGLNSYLFGRLPPTSRLRQALLRRASRLGIEAFNRRDLDALLINHHPAAQFEVPRELTELGVGQSSFSGREGLARFWREWFVAWGELRIEPRELIDLGDRALVRGEARGFGASSGASSGAPLSTDYATIVTFERGRIILQQEYLDHAEALEAVGLRE